MEDFKIIYRILKALQVSMEVEEFNPDVISADAIRCDEIRLENILIQLQRAGYIEGLNIKKYLRRNEYITKPVYPKITIKGLEYLQDNSLMKKAENLIKGIVEII